MSPEEELREAQSLAGRFVQNFATIELLVVCWLFRLEASEADAKAALAKNPTIAARVRRLIELLPTKIDPEGASLSLHLARIEKLRRFRNAFLHGAGGIDEKSQLVLVGWKGIEPFSLAAIQGHVDDARDLLIALNDKYLERFGEQPTLQIAIKAAPPPTD
jgi:hypothetical protein